MATYIVSYDLKKPGKDYSKLLKHLKSYGNWWHHLDSTWVIVTHKSAVEVRDETAAHMDANDLLLVVKSAGVGAWRGFNQEGSEWLKANL